MLQKGVSRNVSLSAKLLDLNEFFDDPKNWGEISVKAGRPWRVDELRRKNSADLHRLWYILLKERNMLMTMEEEHWRRLERMPNPERFEKVSLVFEIQGFISPLNRLKRAWKIFFK